MQTTGVSYWPADTSVALDELTVGDALRTAAAKAPDRTAIIEGTADPGSRRRLTYAELLRQSERVAAALLHHFEPGEHVAVWSGNSLEWILLEYGAALAGLVLVTINPAYQPRELDYVLRQSRATGLFHMSAFRGNPMDAIVAEVRPGLPDLREVVSFAAWDGFVSSARQGRSLPEVDPADPVQIQYTSGTTGFPKGVLLHHHGLVNNARFVAQRLGIEPNDVLVWPIPLFHTAGCAIGVLGALSATAAFVPLHQFDPGLQLALIESERATVSGGVPTMLNALLRHPDAPRRDLSTLKTMMAGGAPVPAQLARACEQQFGVTFNIVYGTTECSPIVTQTQLDDPADRRTGTVGRALPHTEVMIADPITGQPVAIGEVGELCVRGYLVMSGYFDLPEATAAAIDSDGWYHTGDLARISADGYVHVEDRLKDMIIRGGENIYPREIEDLLLAHPAVAEVAIVGKPDAHWGETVAAFVHLTPGFEVSEEELFAYCRAHLSAYKTPATWVFTRSFPMTASGKTRKNVLREQLTSRGEER